ncbi:unnamed protein product [Ranitomeya imitator]|uniref:Uncharacterized protein n=1 Tax=Ranitomeya imitator TaxID=111125 RepID=A0ABN9L0N2_9NEOB|nr:unnamed protein product [Ranitomeya imitator]
MEVDASPIDAGAVLFQKDAQAYHPETNGLVERANQTLVTYLRHFVSARQDEWASLLPWAEFALNNAVADSARQTPFLLNYGQHPWVPVPMPVSSADSRVANWAVEARDTWDHTQDAIRASKERMRSSAYAHRCPAPTFAPGDLVWLSGRNIRLQVESTRFAPHYLGPFKVLEQVNPVVYRLALPPRLGITDTFHVSLLKPVYMSWFSESSAGTSGSSTDDYEVLGACWEYSGSAASFESDYIYSNRLFQTHCLLWRRYIDDVFCLWHGTNESLLEFFSEINGVWPELSFTLNFDKHEINYLDTKILQDQDGKLTLDLYTKATDCNNLLFYQSCHPKAVKKSIPLSQFERVRRIVSNPEVRKQRLDEMQQKFIQRGYPPRLLQQAQLRPQSSSKLSISQRIAFVHTFHPFMYKVHRTIRKHWPILRESFPNIPEFQAPFLPCFRRPKNLKNKIIGYISVIKTHFGTNLLAGRFGGRTAHAPAILEDGGAQERRRTDPGSICVTGRIGTDFHDAYAVSQVGKGLIIPKQTFLSTPCTGTFPCLQCANVLKVYAIKCPCGKVYVGETTQAIKDRISHHKSDIRCQKNHLPILYHFNSSGHTVAQLRFLVLEQVNLNRRGGGLIKKLLEREAFWIHSLQSMEPRASAIVASTGQQRADVFGTKSYFSPSEHAQSSSSYEDIQQRAQHRNSRAEGSNHAPQYTNQMNKDN